MEVPRKSVTVRAGKPWIIFFAYTEGMSERFPLTTPVLRDRGFDMNGVKNQQGKLMRFGISTGSCAAAAAKAAVLLLLGGREVGRVTILTPHDQTLEIPIEESLAGENSACCAVRKDAGDDPDVTHGILIRAQASKIAEGVEIEGGAGVGRVTLPGLDQPPGEAAINSVPRMMIERSVWEAAAEQGYRGGVRIVISVPGGELLAQKTFNPRLGIVGGISIIGTSGLVEPMSHGAIRDTVRLEIRQLGAKGGSDLILVPGNYGEHFALTQLHLPKAFMVSCSNWIGDAIDTAVETGFTRILLVGHIGKLIKLALGMPNTHSLNGDGRMEVLVTAALQAGAKLPLLRAVSGCVMTDAALGLLQEQELLSETMRIIGSRMEDFLQRRVPTEVQIACVCFSRDESLGGVLYQSQAAAPWLREWEE